MNDTIEVAYFPLWRRYAQMFRETGLTDSQMGKLLGMMMDYQFEGKEPETVPRALAFAWPYLKKDLDDARRQYETSVRNGKKGGRPKKKSNEEATQNPEITQEETQGENRENPEKGNTMSMSRSMSTSMSMSGSMTNTRTISNTDTDTGSAPACEEAGISVGKKTYGEFGWVRLTQGQYEDLQRRMGPSELHRCITYVDEAAQSTGNRNRWKDWYLLLRRCHENRWYDSGHRQKQTIPTGASGELGEAELEAIRMLMAER